MISYDGSRIHTAKLNMTTSLEVRRLLLFLYEHVLFFLLELLDQSKGAIHFRAGLSALFVA